MCRKDEIPSFLHITDRVCESNGRGEYERRFADAFRAQVPYEDLPSVLAQLRTLSPLDVTSVTGEPPIDLVASAASADGTPVRIVIDLSSDGRIETFLVQPAEQPTLDEPPTSPQAAADPRTVRAQDRRRRHPSGVDRR